MRVEKWMDSELSILASSVAEPYNFHTDPDPGCEKKFATDPDPGKN